MEMAADAGMIAWARSAWVPAPPLYMAAWNASSAPIHGLRIPARNGRHIILDFATASMSMAKSKNA